MPRQNPDTASSLEMSLARVATSPSQRPLGAGLAGESHCRDRRLVEGEPGWGMQSSVVPWKAILVTVQSPRNEFP